MFITLERDPSNHHIATYNQTITSPTFVNGINVPNINAFTLGASGTTSIETDQGTVNPIAANLSPVLYSLGTIGGPCLDGGSIVQTLSGPKRMDQLTIHDQILTPDQIYVPIKNVVQCGLAFPGSNHNHQAVILEPDALSPGVPNQRLIIDPGHPIGPDLKPAGSFLSEENKKIYLGQWNPPYTRYDLVLQEPHQTYLANNVIIKARKSRQEAGYEHWYQGYY